VLDLFLDYAIPFIVTTILGMIFKKLKDNEQSNKAMQKSMVLLLYIQITIECEKRLSLGYLSDSARSDIEELFEQYKILGGNHGLEKLVDLVFSLPPIKKGSD